MRADNNTVYVGVHTYGVTGDMWEMTWKSLGNLEMSVFVLTSGIEWMDGSMDMC